MFAPADYHFELPTELIAQEPAASRDASRLLHVRSDGSVEDRMFTDIAELLPADSVVVVNDTKVIPARVIGHKDSGGRVELLVLEPEPEAKTPPGTEAWRCLARARRPLKPGQLVKIDGTETTIELLSERMGAEGSVIVAMPGDALSLLDRVGHIPLPRYIQRPDDMVDRARYQTMFAREPGAVAAPTAGLHMTPAIVEKLTARGVTLATVTLHVGYGTFEPIREADIRKHHMHRERYMIPDETAALVASGRPIVALGTTALRALESAATAPRAVRAGPGATELFVYPGSEHTFRVVDHMITNFHLPESTLLMLVCAFAGPKMEPGGPAPTGGPKMEPGGPAPTGGIERVLAAYRHAVTERYRFFSYGDAMLLHRA